MKYLRLFEAFVNEGRVDVKDFADMFSETMANIEGDYDYEEELSTENLLYMLAMAYREVAEQINYSEHREDLRYAFGNFKIKTDDKFMNADLDEEAEYFGSQAYGNTDYHLEGMVDCFCHVLEEFALVKKPVVKKIREYLLEEVDESTKTELTSVNENKYAKAGKLGYNDQFLNKRKSLAKTLSNELGLTKEFIGPFLGFDYVSLFVVGPGNIGGTIVDDALTGKYTYDDLKAAAAEYLKGKNVDIKE